MRKAIVWLKRDLRLHDHRPLAAAAAFGEVVFLYVIEPEYWQQPDTSFRQYRFLQESLDDLSGQCAKIGGRLIIKVGSVVGNLDALRSDFGDVAIFAHEETGNAWTFARDTAVRRWCRKNAVQFTEFKQHGIARGKELNRDKWAKR